MLELRTKLVKATSLTIVDKNKETNIQSKKKKGIWKEEMKDTYGRKNK
jgi:hypothetical protein